jgi:excisionase family DNA binding protein
MSLADQLENVCHALTAEELSKLLRVSKVTIFKMAAAGRIPSFRIAVGFFSLTCSGSEQEPALVNAALS